MNIEYFSKYKSGDIIRIKGIFGIDFIGIFNKIEDETIYLYCAHYADMNNICYVKDGKYCSIHIDNIHACLLATENEIREFYNKIGKYFTEEYDKDWYNHFTDSSYFDVQDFLFDIFCIKLEEYDNDMIYPKFVDEIHHYIWNRLSEVINEGNEYKKDKMVSLDKVCEILKENLYIENIFEYDEDEEPIKYVCASSCDCVEDFINKIRNMLEE